MKYELYTKERATGTYFSEKLATDIWSEVTDYIDSVGNTTGILDLFIRFNNSDLRDVKAGSLFNLTEGKSVRKISLRQIKEEIKTGWYL